ncbi:MAG: AAA family ATPase [Nostoc sp. DedSLP03]|uniref:AAA family ATPase n=1 Tax=Nostoc sp. DedSLP03 TaxID=3075400 RepID=UPI002AD3A369|nr:AAA family ATPase [Nostoc sp. DedSLP03]MDZ7965799.1 AAA family ATPase [Nostoc sp. DedSLP03]
MQVKITLKNYRCFSDSKPARIMIRKGFTAFIGVNNSGKSSLLKFFYEFRSLFASLSNPSNLVNTLSGNSQDLNFPREVLYPQEVFCNTNDRPLTIEFYFLPEGEIGKDSLPIIQEIKVVIPRNNSYTTFITINNQKLNIKQENINLDNGIILNIKKLGELIASVDISYILAEFKHLSKTLYIGPFRNAISVLPILHPSVMNDIDNQYLSYFDINVGRAFIRQWRQFKTGADRNRSIATLELTDDIKRIFSFEQLEINSSNDDQSMQLFINRKVYNLSEIGSGLAQFILVIVNVAIQNPSYILIDEPELNLNPVLQLDFLTTLAKYASQGMLFATHSIGLARASAEYIYTVRQTSQGSEVSEYEKNSSLPELLGELSFSTYREFGFDKVLLVEGPSEIKTIQQFLRKYKQDHHFLLLPLGGSALINATSKSELEEIKRISDKIFALIDSERLSADEALGAERQAFITNCQEIGINCHVLNYRATENYFTDKAVKLVKGDNYSALQPYEKLENARYGWRKSENWRIAKEMTLDELELTDFGQFLKSLCC